MEKSNTPSALRLRRVPRRHGADGGRDVPNGSSRRLFGQGDLRGVPGRIGGERSYTAHVSEERLQTEPRAPGEPRTLTFRRRHRLQHSRQFQAVYQARVRKHRGPLTVFALPNGLDYNRLGLSIGRRVGNAATRNLLKRRLREVFRSLRDGAPQGYDLVIVARPHEAATLEHYHEQIATAVRSLHREWETRGRRGA
jgi:ribonuclease P protein component